MVLTRAMAIAAAAGALACAGGCGGGVTAGDTYDQPLYPSPYSSKLLANATLPATAKPIVGVLWSDPLQRRPDGVLPRGWFGTDLASQSVGKFTFALYRPPPPAAIVRITAPDGLDFADVALADAVLVDDQDGDGDFRPSGIHAEIGPKDSYLAGSLQVILYVARPFSRLPSTFPLPYKHPGYSLIDFHCSGQTGQTSGGAEEVFELQFISQASQRLPEVRNCLRTHSP